MSFILDALRKSENKRHNQHRDSARAVYETQEPKPLKSRRWVVALVLVLLINLILVLWMTSFRQKIPVESPVTNLPTPPTVDSPSAPIAVSSESKAVEPAPAAAPEQPDLTIEVATESESRPIEPEVETQPAPPEIISTTSQTESTDEPIVVSKLYSISELPSALRSRVTALQMPLHAFNANNPTAGMVQIDGRLLRAGDRIANDLKVEEITADGVILRSEEYRFLLPRRGQ